MQKTSVLPEVGFVRLPQVLAVLPMGKSAWYGGIQEGRHPAPVKLGPRISAWRVDDIRALIEQLSAEGGK